MLSIIYNHFVLVFNVDVILIDSFSKDEIGKLKEKLNSKFEMKDLGIAKRILEMDIARNQKKGALFLSQHVT